jgi:hypothetical protein
MPTQNRIKQFHRYKNLSGDSKVARYEVQKDAITIRFTDHTIYRYTNQSAGPANIAKMKTLALAGKGLGTFVETTVKNGFLRKLH